MDAERAAAALIVRAGSGAVYSTWPSQGACAPWKAECSDARTPRGAGPIFINHRQAGWSGEFRADLSSPGQRRI